MPYSSVASVNEMIRVTNRVLEVIVLIRAT